MLNQTAVEALWCSASYVEDYFDCVENLPDDLQRYITQMREFDVKYQEILQEIEHHQHVLREELDMAARKKILLQIQRALIRSQEIGDEKLQIVQFIQDLIENKSRQLEQDRKNLDFGKDQENTEPPTKVEAQPERSSKRSRRQRNESVRDELIHEKQEEKTTTSKKSKKKKRKSKAEKERDDSPVDQPIDPDEPTYCLCEQVSFGEMICCDNEQCAIEWFHFSCVGLSTKPKGKWFCPKCRGDRPNVMKART